MYKMRAIFVKTRLCVYVSIDIQLTAVVLYGHSAQFAKAATSGL